MLIDINPQDWIILRKLANGRGTYTVVSANASQFVPSKAGKEDSIQFSQKFLPVRWLEWPCRYFECWIYWSAWRTRSCAKNAEGERVLGFLCPSTSSSARPVPRCKPTTCSHTHRAEQAFSLSIYFYEKPPRSMWTILRLYLVTIFPGNTNCWSAIFVLTYFQT